MTHRLLDANTAFAVSGRIALFVSRHPPSKERVEELEVELQKLGRELDRFVMMQIIWPRPGVKLEGMRETNARMDTALNAQHKHLAAVGIVMRDKGFLAAALRSVIAASMVMKGGPVPVKIFATPEDAAGWLDQQLPGATTTDLARTIAELDAALA
jgi:hypothetical protein